MILYLGLNMGWYFLVRLWIFLPQRAPSRRKGHRGNVVEALVCRLGGVFFIPKGQHQSVIQGQRVVILSTLPLFEGSSTGHQWIDFLQFSG